MASRRVKQATLACLVLLSGATLAHAQTANAVAQFRLKSNPNGAWSYTAAGALQTDPVKDCAGQAAFRCWSNGGSIPNSAIVGANQSSGTISYYTIVLPAHTIALDPESLSSVQVVWTAAIDETVMVKGKFQGVDTDEATHNVAVLHNGVALKTYAISHYGQKQPFKLTVAVAAGDTIAFASYTQGYAYLTTGLQATITQE